MAEPKRELDDYVDINLLKQIEFNEMKNLGYTVVFTRLDGSIVTQGGIYISRPLLCRSCAFLAHFPNGFHECQRSDAEACKFVGNYYGSLLYRCRAGFSNFAIPIEVDKRIIACLFGGQLLVLKPKWGKQKQDFESFCRDHGIHVKKEPGEVIKDGFFFQGEQIDKSQVEEIAKTSGIGGYEINELERTIEIDFSLQGGRVIDVEEFMRDFAHLEVISKMLSSMGQKVSDLKRKGNSEYKTPSNVQPINIPPHHTLSFRISIPCKQMSPGHREIKELEMELLYSTLTPKARKNLAEVITGIPEGKLDPEIRKVILKALGKQDRSPFKRW